MCFHRKDFNDLRNAKAEVEYCDKLVKQCRERLVRGEYSLKSFQEIFLCVYTLHIYEVYLQN